MTNRFLKSLQVAHFLLFFAIAAISADFLRAATPRVASSVRSESAGATPIAPAAEPATDTSAALTPLGDPLAVGKLQLMTQEITSAFQKRGVSDNFARFQSYAAGRLNATVGKYTGSELTGAGRLSWYDKMMKNMMAAPAEAELFTRTLHKAALDEREGLATILAIAAYRMDQPKRPPISLPEVTSPEQALDTVKSCLAKSQAAFATSVAPLSKSEIRELRTNLVPVMLGNNRFGHTLNDRTSGRRLVDLMEKMDRNALFAAADALGPLADVKLLEQLKGLSFDGDIKVPGVTGRVLAYIDTPGGAIVIGGKESNTYELDKMTDVACVIDLGGNDTYIEGVVAMERPVLVVMDLVGNDVYRGTKPGIQGGSLLGVSMLLDLEGDDLYQAGDLAQGSSMGGVGILIDYAGNDRYIGSRRVQGHSIGGIGILIDREGKDDYRAQMWAQGFGGPLGFGLLDDLKGDDHYFCGGSWPDSYDETPGLEGWGQGVGAGLRQVADGGLGIILDGAGDDVYEFDYLSHGGGYWCGMGFARDFGGNDKRLITRKAYNGGQRTEPKFQRFGCGWGCHYSLGFCIDDGGDDVYEGTIMGSGMGWDCSFGMLADFGGNDRYEAAGGLTQGCGAQASLGILFDYNGDDVYLGYGQGYSSSNLTYHDMPGCGGNFSFVIDYGGEDKYGCGAKNNVFLQRGTSGGFLIDRPRRDETPLTAGKTPVGSGRTAAQSHP